MKAYFLVLASLFAAPLAQAGGERSYRLQADICVNERGEEARLCNLRTNFEDGLLEKIERKGVGSYAFKFRPGYFSGEPACTVSAVGLDETQCKIVESNFRGLSVSCAEASIAAGELTRTDRDTKFVLLCMGNLI